MCIHICHYDTTNLPFNNDDITRTQYREIHLLDNYYLPILLDINEISQNTNSLNNINRLNNIIPYVYFEYQPIIIPGFNLEYLQFIDNIKVYSYNCGLFYNEVIHTTATLISLYIIYYFVNKIIRYITYCYLE